MKKTFLLYILFLAAAFAFTNPCIAQNTKYTVSSGQIPPDFKGYEYTLLVIKHEKSWNKLAEKALIENYTGKYIFVCEEDLDKPEYSNKEEFRFILTKNNFILMGMGMDGMNSGKAATEDLCVFDRKISKQYCTSNSTSFIGKQMKEYTIALNLLRLEK